MSALPSKADIQTVSRDVRYVPIADAHLLRHPRLAQAVCVSVEILASTKWPEIPGIRDAKPRVYLAKALNGLVRLFHPSDQRTGSGIGAKGGSIGGNFARGPFSPQTGFVVST